MNTDSNKLVIFFGIASYNGDNSNLRNMRVGGTHYAYVMFIIREDLNLAMF